MEVDAEKARSQGRERTTKGQEGQEVGVGEWEDADGKGEALKADLMKGDEG